MYAPPRNGALVCLNHDDGNALVCQVACKERTDFVFLPPMLYVCPDSGRWTYFSHFRYNTTLPWPDCAGRFSVPLSLNPHPCSNVGTAVHGGFLLSC